MSETSDPLLAEVRWRFESLLSGGESAPDAVSWSQGQLDHETWRDEVTFQGLMRLADLVAVTWIYADDDPGAHEQLFRSYWDWMEVVRWYEDDPAGWKANYFRGLVTAFGEQFGTERARKAAKSLVASGDLDEEEVARWLMWTRSPRAPLNELR